MTLNAPELAWLAAHGINVKPAPLPALPVMNNLEASFAAHPLNLDTDLERAFQARVDAVISGDGQAMIEAQIAHEAARAPRNLTPADVLRAKANAWLDDNHGTVHIALVEDAIRHSALAGDPFSDNPFRHMLIQVATERGISRYGSTS